MAASPSRRQYLYGVQGLRTVAALLVAVYHIWFGRVSGGVDVFFVVAGFFAAGSLLRLFSKAEDVRSTLGSYVNYLLRTARRVVPSAVVVIVATVFGALLWIPKAYWRDEIEHAWASLGFFENWRLIESSTDYLQQDLSASPFQQFWALAVNVQFYFLFATFVLVLAVVVRLRRREDLGGHLRRALLVGAGAVFFASFVFSIGYTAQDQPAAYFNTFTRLWEFMAGTLAFLLVAAPVRHRKAAKVAGWAGLGALLAFGALFDLSELLPGFLSLVPVLAALGLIWSSIGRVEPSVLLWRPVLWVADASFAFYLWHWPLLVFYMRQYGDEVGLGPGLAVIGVALLLAVLTTKLVEDPIRKSRTLARSGLFTVLAVGGLLGAGAASIVHWQSQLSSPGLVEQWTENTVGSQSGSSADLAQDVTELRPRLEDARGDVSQAYERGCHPKGTDPELVACEWGPEDAPKTVALVGGSHSLMWLEAVIPGAEAAGAKVVSYTKSDCLFGDVDAFGFERDPSCSKWNEALLETLLEDPPDLVVTIGTRNVDGVEQVLPGYQSRFELLSRSGIPVLAIRDNPSFDFDPLVCLEQEDWDECSAPAADFYVSLAQLDFPKLPGIHFLDISELLCPEGTCRVVDGDLLQYRDDNHLTTTWVLEKGGLVSAAVEGLLD